MSNFSNVNTESEDFFQQKCFMWFWNTYIDLRGLLFSVPNGLYRRGIDAKTLKATGQTKGVSDLIFLFNDKAYLIEMKTVKGVHSKVQKEWQKKVEEQGFDYFLVRGDFDRFKQIIKNIVGY